jgi:hypothetical protein
VTDSLSGSPDPFKAQLFEYHVVFADPSPPKEAGFEASNDEGAIETAKKEYPRLRWTLYRTAQGQPIRIYAN